MLKSKPKPKIILHLITGLEIGGAEMMLTKILPLTQEEFSHHVVSIIGPGPIGDILSKQGIEVHHLNLKHKFDLSIINKFKLLVAQIQPDTLITYLPHADIFGRIMGRLLRIPTIITSVRVKLWQSKYLPLFILDGITSPLVSHYHFNSPSVALKHRQYLGIPRHKITVIPNAIDTSSIPAEINHLQKKISLGLSTNTTLIGCVARLRKQKGHSYLINAWPKVIASYPDTHLVLVGDGAEKQKLTTLVNKLNLNQHVTFLGNRRDVSEILPLLEIFIQPTLYEGMSNSLMEAMAARIPIITTDIPENQDLLEHQISALLVPIKNSHALSRAIIALLDNPIIRHALANNALQKITQNYSIDQIIPQYKDFFETLTKPKIKKST